MTHIYHITHLKNLKSILEEGLLCDSEVKKRKFPFQEIGYREIKRRREVRPVPTSNRGYLADYVPFYFAPRSPMLYKISHGEVDDYKDGQEPILHLVSTVERVVESNLQFTFTNGHAEMKPTEFYERVTDLVNIDWELMESQFWFDTETDLNRKWRRQAEFLVHMLFPTDLLIGIAVISEDVKREVDQLLAECGQQIKVVVRPSYYY